MRRTNTSSIMQDTALPFLRAPSRPQGAMVMPLAGSSRGCPPAEAAVEGYTCGVKGRSFSEGPTTGLRPSVPGPCPCRDPSCHGDVMTLSLARAAKAYTCRGLR
jgi:hypothetical protein